MSGGCPDSRFPACTPQPITDPIFNDQVKVPLPPSYKEWTAFLQSQSKSEFPLLDTAPSPTGTPYQPGKATGPGGAPWGINNPTSEMFMCHEKGTWALTYDDGPFDFTNDFMDYLRSVNVKGTFFVVGANIARNPGWAKALQAVYSAGHQIATHQRMTSLTTDKVFAEIVWNMLAVKSVIGKYPRYFRFPFAKTNLVAPFPDTDGDIDDRMRSIIYALGLRAAHWNVLADDTSIPAGDKTPPGATGPVWHIKDAVERFRGTIRNGSMVGLDWLPGGPPYSSFISLQHETAAEHLTVTREVTPLVLNAGFKTVLISECDNMAGKDYLEDSEPFAQFLNSLRLPVDPANPVGGNSGTGGGTSSGGSNTAMAYPDVNATPSSGTAATPTGKAAAASSGGLTMFGLRGGSAVGILVGVVLVAVLAVVAVGLAVMYHQRRRRLAEEAKHESGGNFLGPEVVAMDPVSATARSGDPGISAPFKVSNSPSQGSTVLDGAAVAAAVSAAGSVRRAPSTHSAVRAPSTHSAAGSTSPGRPPVPTILPPVFHQQLGEAGLPGSPRPGSASSARLPYAPTASGASPRPYVAASQELAMVMAADGVRRSGSLPTGYHTARAAPLSESPRARLHHSNSYSGARGYRGGNAAGL
ncbi:chitin deacetylase [Phlyctochytrium bullatum]|nr:chitin deacetylase [Phlyctochytrium bullatum]